MRNNTGLLEAIYLGLHARYGPQEWWPTHGGGAWEIFMGAVLTQRTTWTNVELALQNVLSLWGPEGLAKPEMVLDAPPETLAALLRPAGYHTAKPRKVRELARFVVAGGGIDALLLSTESTESLRERLLSVWGIGPETADAILLYALGRPVFVADAYALRLAARWGLLEPGASYSEVQALFMENLPMDAGLFNEFHALIVAHGKTLCRPRPRCQVCPLAEPLSLDNGTTWQCPRFYTGNRV